MSEQPNGTAQQSDWMPRIETSICPNCGKSIPLGADGLICGHSPCEPNGTAESPRSSVLEAAQLIKAYIEDRGYWEPADIVGFIEAASSGVSAARFDKLKAAFTENEQLTDSLLKSLEERDDTIQQLRSYVQHNSDCELRDTWTKQERCTCGLAKLLENLGETEVK